MICGDCGEDSFEISPKLSFCIHCKLMFLGRRDGMKILTEEDIADMIQPTSNRIVAIEQNIEALAIANMQVIEQLKMEIEILADELLGVR